MGMMTDAELLRPPAPDADLGAGHFNWWPWAALGFGAAIVVVGGILFTPSSDGPSPRDGGQCHASICGVEPDHQ
jgi:hypothetical protein